jgi:hypothetical protein
LRWLGASPTGRSREDHTSISRTLTRYYPITILFIVLPSCARVLMAHSDSGQVAYRLVDRTIDFHILAPHTGLLDPIPSFGSKLPARGLVV